MSQAAPRKGPIGEPTHVSCYLSVHSLPHDRYRCRRPPQPCVCGRSFAQAARRVQLPDRRRRAAPEAPARAVSDHPRGGSALALDAQAPGEAWALGAVKVPRMSTKSFHAQVADLVPTTLRPGLLPLFEMLRALHQQIRWLDRAVRCRRLRCGASSVGAELWLRRLPWAEERGGGDPRLDSSGLSRPCGPGLRRPFP